MCGMRRWAYILYIERVVIRMSTGGLFRGDVGSDAGVEDLALVMFGLECAMEYPKTTSTVGGVLLWDSVVQGGGDIMLPRLIRVVNASQREDGGGGLIVKPDKAPGYYSGRLRVSLTNRRWKFVNSKEMVVAGSNPCLVEVDVYGLVFVRPLPDKPVAAPASQIHFISEYLWVVSARKAAIVWDWFVENARA